MLYYLEINKFIQRDIGKLNIYCIKQLIKAFQSNKSFMNVILPCNYLNVYEITFSLLQVINGIKTDSNKILILYEASKYWGGKSQQLFIESADIRTADGKYIEISGLTQSYALRKNGNFSARSLKESHVVLMDIKYFYSHIKNGINHDQTKMDYLQRFGLQNFDQLIVLNAYQLKSNKCLESLWGFLDFKEFYTNNKNAQIITISCSIKDKDKNKMHFELEKKFIKCDKNCSKMIV